MKAMPFKTERMCYKHKDKMRRVALINASLLLTSEKYVCMKHKNE